MADPNDQVMGIIAYCVSSEVFFYLPIEQIGATVPLRLDMKLDIGALNINNLPVSPLVTIVEGPDDPQHVGYIAAILKRGKRFLCTEVYV